MLKTAIEIGTCLFIWVATFAILLITLVGFIAAIKEKK